VAKVWCLACKKGVFALQEVGFYIAKRGFLHAKNPLFVFR